MPIFIPEQIYVTVFSFAVLREFERIKISYAWKTKNDQSASNTLNTKRKTLINNSKKSAKESVSRL